MRNKNKGGVVDDMWLNTQVADYDDDTINSADAPVGWDELEEANNLLNPDAESMDWRG